MTASRWSVAGSGCAIASLRPTLDVEVAGERRRMLAVLEHKPWAAEDGEDWVAAFAQGERATLDDAELTVSPDSRCSCCCPRPSGTWASPRPRQSRPPSGCRPGGRARRSWRTSPAAALAEVGRPRRSWRKPGSHTPRQSASCASARLAQEEPGSPRSSWRKASGRLSTAEAHAETRLEEAQREVDEAASAREDAVAEAAAARAERDAALKKLAELERERDALAEARDRAREERNAWMSRARGDLRAPRRRGGRPRAHAHRGRAAAAPADQTASRAHGPLPPALSRPIPNPNPMRLRLPPSGAPFGSASGRAAQAGPSRRACAWPSHTIWTPQVIAVVALIAVGVIVALLLLLAL